MSRQGYFFYLPSGCLSSFDLLSIHFISSDADSSHTLSVRHDGNVYEINKSSIHGCETIWSVDSFPDFADLRASRFEAILDDQVFAVSFDSLSLIAVADAWTTDTAPKDILIFHFVAGYFARSCDFRMGRISVPGVKSLRPGRREALQRACSKLHGDSIEFEDCFDSKFSEIYEHHRENEESRRNASSQKFDTYLTSVANTPVIPGNYCIDPRSSDTEGVKIRSPPSQSCLAESGSTIGDRGRRTSLRPSRTSSTKTISGGSPRGRPRAASDELPPIAPFPAERNGWRSPSTAEIKMCLAELVEIFPLDADKKMFCNISEEDPDVSAQRTFLFDVIHFMTLVAQFTGIVFDYRIKLVEGCYRFEERITGTEVRRDWNSKNVHTNPYRAAVLSCLRKICHEFKLSVTAQSIIGHIAAIMKFHETLYTPEEVYS